MYGAPHRDPTPPRSGVYAPLCTFFKPDSEDLDLDTIAKHALYIAGSDVGLVACGSMGEAHHLTRTERALVLRTVRATLDANSLSHIPLVAGTGGNSTRETILLTNDAADEGATHAMVIAPGYFAGALDRKALKTFFCDVARESRIPIIIYNFPSAASQIDLDSDLISEIARESPNIVGCKLTCGSIGKMSRLTSCRPNFGVLGGFVDILGPSMLLNSIGSITGTANVAPVRPSILDFPLRSNPDFLPVPQNQFQKTCLALYSLTRAALSTPSLLSKAIELQEIVSEGDWALQKTGIAGTKFVLDKVRGYGGVPRKPILPFGVGEKGEVEGQKLMKEMGRLLEYERKLE